MKIKNSKAKKVSVIVGGIAVITLVGLLVYFYNKTETPVTINISNESVKLDGLFTVKNVVDLKSITEVEYVTQKLNANGIIMGGSIGDKIFGYDKINNWIDAYCYIENSQEPSLLIKTKNKNYLINTNNEQEIKNDYNKLKEDIKKI